MEEGEWLTTNGGYPACCGTVTDPIEGNSGCRVRLDIELALDEHQTIVESFGDVGETPEEAVRNSLFNFCQSSLHVVLSDCWQVHDEEQVLREVWTINNRSWQMTIGNFIRKAEHGADIPIPNEIFTTIEKANWSCSTVAAFS
ncbi:MAG: DUF6348 family protein [Planctomycetes bacterium]|nr:DUF6348 family protein [Planctomycetota bacterium]